MSRIVRQQHNRPNMCCLSNKKPKIQYLIYPGILLLIIGLPVLLLWNTIGMYIVNTALVLQPDSNVYKSWRKSPNPSNLEIFFHNWTNPYDGHNSSIKPRFEEIGPFTFREVKEKVNITWNSNDTVSYRQLRVWHFIPELSKYDLSTRLTTINAVLVAMSHKSRYWNGILRTTVNFGLRAFTPHLHVTKNASQMLFGGYVDQLLSISKQLGIPGLPPVEKFGWFYGKNQSYMNDGLFNMEISSTKRGTIRTWNTWTKTPYYSGRCADVHGSAGELYAPGQTRLKTSFFSPDMCRNVPLDYEKDVSIHGLTGYKYIAYHSLLDNGTLYPESNCYCNNGCMPSGVLNISACRSNSPTFLSLPHFLHADPVYVRNVEGLKPNRSLHEFYIVLEPNTGLPLEAAGRIQMNMHLKPISYMSIINDVPNVMFPVLWFQIKTNSNPKMAAQLKFLTQLPIILKASAFVFIIVGLVMICIGLCTHSRVVERLNNNVCNASKEQVPLQQNQKTTSATIS